MRMRPVLWVGIVAAMAVMGFGCGGSDDSSGGNASPLVGTWTATMGADNPGDPDITVVLTVQADNTFAVIEGGVAAGNSPGTWSVSGNQLTLIGPESTETMTYSIDGNTLTLNIVNGDNSISTILFTRV